MHNICLFKPFSLGKYMLKAILSKVYEEILYKSLQDQCILIAFAVRERNIFQLEPYG